MKRNLKAHHSRQEPDQPPPHDKDAEILVLGSIIYDAMNFRKVSRLVGVGDFFIPENRVLFEALSQLAGEDRTTDDATLIEHLHDAGLLEKAGGQARVATLADGIYSKFDVTIPAKRVHELSVLRQIAMRANLTVEAALKPGASARDVLKSSLEAMRQLAPHASVAKCFSSPGNGAEILEDVERLIRRFVVLTADQAAILATWTAHTHAFTCSTATPYLHITSAEKQSGKTRLLEVLELLTANPWLTGRTSAAVLPRKIDGESPTLLLDESDAAFGGEKEYGEALRGILNSGHRLGGRTSLCVGKGADISPRDFSTFCPKAIAGLGKLPDTVADRSIPIVLKRATAEELSERFRRRFVEPEASELRDRLAQWTASVFDTLDKAEPFLPESLSDRQQDGAEPLLAIADAAGGDWPFKVRNALVSIFAGSDHADGIRVRLLADIRGIFEETVTDRVSSEALVNHLARIETSPWAEWSHGKPLSKGKMARLLHPFGITPGTHRMDDGKPAKGYLRSDFEDSWTRYLSTPSPQSVTTLQANTDAGSSVISKGNGRSAVTLSKGEIINAGAACNVVTDLPEGEEQEGGERQLD